MLRRFGGHRDHGDADAFRRTIFFRSLMSWIGTPLATRWPTLALGVVEHRDDLEAFLAEPRIVGQRQPEVAGAHHRDAQLAIEAEDLPQVALEDP